MFVRLLLVLVGCVSPLPGGVRGAEECCVKVDPVKKQLVDAQGKSREMWLHCNNISCLSSHRTSAYLSWSQCSTYSLANY